MPVSSDDVCSHTNRDRRHRCQAPGHIRRYGMQSARLKLRIERIEQFKYSNVCCFVPLLAGALSITWIIRRSEFQRNWVQILARSSTASMHLFREKKNY